MSVKFLLSITKCRFWFSSFFLYTASCLTAQEMDVAVIGGGINGTYISWKLHSMENSEGENPQVELFESTDRIGGRLYTVFFPDMKHVPVELGGMRFKTNHHHIHRLAKELGLTVVPFISEPTNNLYYLRGTWLRKQELTDSSKLPYKLAKNEQNKSASDILMDAASILVPNIRSIKKEDWLTARSSLTYEGKLLKDISWINFLSNHISPEAFQFLFDIGDIQLKSDVSALSSLDLMVGEDDGKVFKIAEGYQSIPLGLAEKFQNAGGTIHLNHHLTRIVRSTSNGISGYDLSFTDDTGSETHYFAKKVVFTISPTALLHILPQTPLANDAALLQNLRSVTPNVLTKLFFAYRNPWWRSLNLKEGHSATSMLIRNCYYFPSEEDALNGEKGNTNALILASYQGTFNSIWQSLNQPLSMNDPVAHGLSFPLSKTGLDFAWRPVANVSAQQRVISQAQHELKVLHNISDVPEPYAAAFQDWSQPPYYAAFYFWNVGVDPHLVDLEIRKPLSQEEIYIFSSDFCEHQGWAECAIEAADRLLEKYFSSSLTR